MDPKSELFVQKLLALAPTGDEVELEETLYRLVGLLDDAENAFETIPTIFDFIERYPEADLGAPGPLVHFIERFYPAYLGGLFASIERKPTVLTVWMLNRILIAKISPEPRARILSLLHSAATHPAADPAARESAAHFIQFQASGLASAS